VTRQPSPRKEGPSGPGGTAGFLGDKGHAVEATLDMQRGLEEACSGLPAKKDHRGKSF